MIHFGCKQETSEYPGFTNLKVEYLESVKLSDLIEMDYSYLPLESDTSNLIGVINRIIIKDSLIYILDSDIAKKIFCYDKLGRLKFSFGRVGDGPGEYGRPTDMAVTKDKILVHDGTNFTMLTYDLAGNFQHEETIGYWIQEFMPFEEDKYIVYTPTDYAPGGLEGEPNVLKVVSADFVEVAAEFFPYEEVLDDASFAGLLTSYKNTYSYSRPIYGHIYGIDSNYNIRPRYNIDFGKHSWPIEMNDIKLNQEMSEQLLFRGNIMTIVHRLSETENYFIFQTFMIEEMANRNKLDYSKDRWLCIYQKGTDKIYAIHNIKNDIDGGVFSFPITTYGNLFMSVIQAEALISDSSVDTITLLDMVKYKELENLIDSLDIFNNPVLLTYRLKSNLDL